MVGDERDPADVLGRAREVTRRGQYLCGPQLLQLLLGVAQPPEHPGQTLGHLGPGRLEHIGDLRDEHGLAGQVAVGVQADQGLHPPDPRPDRGLAQQLDQAELPGTAHMRATTELTGVLADRDDPHPVAVLLAEHRDGAGPACLVGVHHLGVHIEILDQHLVDRLLHVGQHRHRHRTGAGEVEAEPAGRVLRAGLRGARAQRVPQGLVGQVGGAVGPRDRPPPGRVDLGPRVHPDRDPARAHPTTMDDQSW